MSESPRKDSSRKRLSLLCLAITSGLLFAGLWPFRFRPPNNVRWIDGEPGLRFDRHGIVLGNDPLFASDGVIDLSMPFSIHMELRPHEEPSDSLPRILSAFDAKGREIFLLAQWRSGLALRILEGERFGRPIYRETGAGNFPKDIRTSVVMRSGADGVTIYTGDTPARTRAGVAFSLLSWHRAPARIVLGNSPTGENPWRGDILSLSIYRSALAPADIEAGRIAPAMRYDFREGHGSVIRGGDDPRWDLLIPAVFSAPAKGILSPPWKVQKYNRSFWKDVFVNILGFIPFGFVLFAVFRKGGERKDVSTIIITLALGAGISLFIEWIQVYLPTRDSSLTDVMNNVLGTYIGAHLFRKAHRTLTA